MTRFTQFISSCTLAAALGLGGLALAQPAAAAPASLPVLNALNAAASTSAPIEDVRWVQRCRPRTVVRPGRHGRPVRVTRDVCRQVWVGPARHR